MEKFPILMSDTKPQIQEAQRTLTRINAKKKKKNPTPKPKINHQPPPKTKHKSSPPKQSQTKTILRHITFRLQKIIGREKNPERSQRKKAS